MSNLDQIDFVFFFIVPQKRIIEGRYLKLSPGSLNYFFIHDNILKIFQITLSYLVHNFKEFLNSE